jgi:beta-glucosidase
VLTSSYPYALGWAKDNLAALLWSSHGGQEHGDALADVIFGSDPAGAPAGPTGRLTQTWYADAGALPDLLDYDIVTADATYLYYRGTPVFPFGHGLSYTTFAYQNLRLDSSDVEPGDTVTVTVDVVNTGDRAGDEVVQLYTRQQRSRVKQPVRRLRGYRRVRLAPGERATVRLELPAGELAFWDVTRSRWVVEDARHTVAVGSSSTDWRATATLRVRGERIPARCPRSGLRLEDNDGYAETAPVPVADDSGTGLRSVSPGAWAVFDDVDFGAGVTRVSASVAGAAAGSITLRLDDPFTGSVLATLAVPVVAGREDLAEVTAPVTPATGIHSVFVRYEEPGLTVARLTFDGRR